MTIALRIPSSHALIRTAVALSALFGSASALAVTIAYSGSGAVTGPAQTPPALTGLTMSSATSAYTFGADANWHVDKVFFFNTATLQGGGTFSFGNGSDSLSGTFTSSRANASSPTVLNYTVSGGTGSFAGYVGTGSGTGSTVGNPFSLPAGTVSFSESGTFEISPVPEPASALLLALGLGAAAVWRRRPGKPG